MAHDHLDRDALVGAVPAVVVGAHADECVGDLGLAEEFALGHGGHVDDGYGEFGGEGAVEEGFGAGGELGPFCWGWVSWGVACLVGGGEAGGDVDWMG